MANTSKTTARNKTTVTQKPPKAIASARKPRTTRNSEISPGQRQEMVAEAAYLRAEQRGFGPGDPMEDWLAAEREVDLLLAQHTTPVTQ